MYKNIQMRRPREKKKKEKQLSPTSSNSSFNMTMVRVTPAQALFDTRGSAEDMVKKPCGVQGPGQADMSLSPSSQKTHMLHIWRLSLLCGVAHAGTDATPKRGGLARICSPI